MQARQQGTSIVSSGRKDRRLVGRAHPFSLHQCLPEHIYRTSTGSSRDSRGREGSRGSERVPSCHAVSCHAVSCHAVLCHAVLCHAVPCRAVPCQTYSPTPGLVNLLCWTNSNGSARISTASTVGDQAWCVNGSTVVGTARLAAPVRFCRLRDRRQSNNVEADGTGTGTGTGSGPARSAHPASAAYFPAMDSAIFCGIAVGKPDSESAR